MILALFINLLNLTITEGNIYSFTRTDYSKSHYFLSELTCAVMDVDYTRTLDYFWHDIRTDSTRYEVDSATNTYQVNYEGDEAWIIGYREPLIDNYGEPLSYYYKSEDSILFWKSIYRHRTEARDSINKVYT